MNITPVSPGAMADWEATLWQVVTAQFHGDPDYSIHGPAHWKRVRRNGLLLAPQTGADPLVVRLFAVFHDSRRLNDMTDPSHGERGAVYAVKLWNEQRFPATASQLQLVVDACDGHTDKLHHGDPSVGTCWDADRLDLGRCGFVPDAHFMSTDFAREIARAGSVEPFLTAASL